MPPSHRQKQSARNNAALAKLEEKVSVTLLLIEEKNVKRAYLYKELKNDVEWRKCG